MHRAVGGRASGLRGGAEVLGESVSLCGAGAGLRRGMGCEGGEECIAQSAGVHRRCVGERKSSGRACRCARAGEGLRRGRCCEVGEECIAQPAGVHRRSVGERKCSEGRVAVRGRGRPSAGNASRSRRACIGAAWRSGSVRDGRVAVGGRAKAFGGECIAQPAGVHRRCVGKRKCSGRACRCAGAGVGLRRGMGCEDGEECIAQSAGVRRDCVGERRASARACRCAGRAKTFGGEWVVRTARNASRSRRACIGTAWGSGSTRGGRVAVRGRAKAFGGEWAVRAASLTHIRRSGSRARVLLYIRPPVHVVKSQPRDRKGVPAFTLPPHRLRRRPRSNRPPAATVIHNGLSTEKLSTSLLAALCKTFAPSRRCGTASRAAVRRVGEGGRQRRTHPRAVPNHAACVPSNAACVPTNAACCAEQRRLCAESLCAKAEVHKANPATARALSPRQLVYRRAPAA